MRNIVRFEVEGGPRTLRQAVKATLKYGNDVKHCYSFLSLNLGGPAGVYSGQQGTNFSVGIPSVAISHHSLSLLSIPLSKPYRYR